MYKVITLSIFLITVVLGKTQTNITPAEVDILAKKVNALAQQKNWKEIDAKYFDVVTFGNRVAQYLKYDKTKTDKFVEGLKSARVEDAIMVQLGNVIQSFEYLRTKKINNQYHFICRVLVPNGGVNYLNFLVAKNTKNELKIIDAYSFLLTEYMSGLVGSVLVGSDAEEEEDKLSDVFIMRAFITAKKAGNYIGMLQMYNELDAAKKKQKVFLNLRMAAAQEVGDEEYKKAIDDYYKYYPNEMGLTLLMVDRYLFDENYTAALQAINKTDSIIGGDIYLEFLRANIYTNMDDYEPAEKSYERFLAKFPDYVEVYPTYVSILLYFDEYDKAIQVVKKCKKDYNVNPLEEISTEDFPEFFESEAYKNYSSGK